MSGLKAVQAFAISGPDGKPRFISLWQGEEMAWIDYINTFHLWNQTILNDQGWKVLPGHTLQPVTISASGEYELLRELVDHLKSFGGWWAEEGSVMDELHKRIDRALAHREQEGRG